MADENPGVRVCSLVAVLALMLGCKDKPVPVAKPPVPPAVTDAPAAPDDRTDAVLELYDQQEFAGAAAGAEAVLRDEPDNIRMLRVAISSYCFLGDADRAKHHWGRLPPRDQQQMTTRCSRLGITLP